MHIPSISRTDIVLTFLPILRLAPIVESSRIAVKYSSHSTRSSGIAEMAVHFSVPFPDPGEKVRGTKDSGK